jgi:hypothetical protein
VLKQVAVSVNIVAIFCKELKPEKVLCVCVCVRALKVKLESLWPSSRNWFAVMRPLIDLCSGSVVVMGELWYRQRLWQSLI